MSSSDEQALLAKFLQPPSPQASLTKLHNGRKRAHSGGGDTDDAAVQTRGQDSNARKPKPEQSSKSKRRRSSRGENKLEGRNSGAITSNEEYDLISHYTDLFLSHMDDVERRLTGSPADKNSVASKVRSVTSHSRNGRRVHVSVTGLHNEFKQYAINPQTDAPVRYALEVELIKFVVALPYWSPKCKGLSRQQDRLSMIDRLVQMITDNEFNEADYKADYDPDNEL